MALTGLYCCSPCPSSSRQNSPVLSLSLKPAIVHLTIPVHPSVSTQREICVHNTMGSKPSASILNSTSELTELLMAERSDEQNKQILLLLLLLQ